MNKFVKLTERAHRILKLAAARAGVSMAELLTSLIFDIFDEDGQKKGKNSGKTVAKQWENSGK